MDIYDGVVLDAPTEELAGGLNERDQKLREEKQRLRDALAEVQGVDFAKTDADELQDRINDVNAGKLDFLQGELALCTDAVPFFTAKYRLAGEQKAALQPELKPLEDKLLAGLVALGWPSSSFVYGSDGGTRKTEFKAFLRENTQWRELHSNISKLQQIAGERRDEKKNNERIAALRKEISDYRARALKKISDELI